MAPFDQSNHGALSLWIAPLELGSAVTLCLMNWISKWIIISAFTWKVHFGLSSGCWRNSKTWRDRQLWCNSYTQAIFPAEWELLWPRAQNADPPAFHEPKMNHVISIPQIRHQVRSYCSWIMAIMWFMKQRLGTKQSSEHLTELEGISKHENMQRFRGNVIKRGIRPIDHCLHSAVISKNNFSSHFWEPERNFRSYIHILRRPYVT